MRRALVFSLFLLLSVPASAFAHESSADFINQMSVNTHMQYTDGNYANVSQVIADLSYLGISHVRDGISNGAYGSAPLSTYTTMARAGVKWVFLPIVGGHDTDASLGATVSLIRQVELSVPGSVMALEGANEINNFPMTWDGAPVNNQQDELDAALASQHALYAEVHNDATFAGVKVAMFTGNDGEPDVMTTPGLADYVTQHPYPNGGQAPVGYMARARATPSDQTGPAIYAETGYSTNGASYAVSENVQMRYGLDLFCDTAKLGIVQTSWYQLLDAYATGSPQGNEGFGLFRFDGSPKPLGMAIHNMTSILEDSAAHAPQYAASHYKLFDSTGTSRVMLTMRSTGYSDIIVWTEPPLWNSSTHAEVKPASHAALIVLNGTYRSIQVFDPTVGTNPIQSDQDTSAVSLQLLDHPLIVRVGPALPGDNMWGK